jgi:hypothetical protein
LIETAHPPPHIDGEHVKRATPVCGRSPQIRQDIHESFNVVPANSALAAGIERLYSTR